MLPINEIREMRRMGEVCKVKYVSLKGIPFHKYFHDEKEMKKFTEEAKAVGTKFVSIEMI